MSENSSYTTIGFWNTSAITKMHNYTRWNLSSWRVRRVSRTKQIKTFDVIRNGYIQIILKHILINFLISRLVFIKPANSIHYCCTIFRSGKSLTKKNCENFERKDINRFSRMTTMQLFLRWDFTSTIILTNYQPISLRSAESVDLVLVIIISYMICSLKASSDASQICSYFKTLCLLLQLTWYAF